MNGILDKTGKDVCGIFIVFSHNQSLYTFGNARPCIHPAKNLCKDGFAVLPVWNAGGWTCLKTCLKIGMR